jgi:hypothetical protein
VKIGILTYHDGPNHGAFLQAWATFRTLTDAGHDVEIVNYKNPRHQAMESGVGLRQWRNPLFAWRQKRKLRVFADAQRHFKLGPFTTDADTLRQRAYDCVVIGSDVVWNHHLFGYDPVYFGRLNARRRVAFSASFGTVGPEDDRPPELADDLAAFDAIAVRDDNSRTIVRLATGRDATLTLDPTLIYDFTPDLPAAPEPSPPEPTLLVYSYRHPPAAIDRAKAYAAEHGLTLRCVGYPPPTRAPRYCASIDAAVGPFEWVARYRRATAVMTSTFHGVVFSLKARKPFLFIATDKTHHRVRSLLDASGIEHDLRLGRQDEVTFFDPDYDAVQRRLGPMADASRRWLLDSVTPDAKPTPDATPDG